VQITNAAHPGRIIPDWSPSVDLCHAPRCSGTIQQMREIRANIARGSSSEARRAERPPERATRERKITTLLSRPIVLRRCSGTKRRPVENAARWQIWCARIPAITMRNGLLARLFVTSTVLGVFACPAIAAPITFNTRTSFNAAAPGLLVETFESRDAEGALICPGPLKRGQECPMTPGTVLPEPPFDGLLPGITYSSTSGILVLLGSDFLPLGNTSNVLGPFAVGDTMDLTLESASAIGFDVFPGLEPADILISVFDPLNAPIGTFTILASPGGTFFGVLSDSGLIGRVNIDTLAEFQGGLIDDVAFGMTPVPEPATILLVGTGLGLGALARRGRRHRPPRQPN
jgi:PEP-CTERM motif-containing protein